MSKKYRKNSSLKTFLERDLEWTASECTKQSHTNTVKKMLAEVRKRLKRLKSPWNDVRYEMAIEDAIKIVKWRV